MHTPAIHGFDAALKELQPDMAEAIVWVVPPDEKHFDPITVVSVFGTTLLMAFLAGFQDEATKQAKAFGGVAATWLAGKLKEFVSLDTVAAPPAVETGAREAALRLAHGEADPEARAANQAALAASEAAIAEVLKEYMPAAKAGQVASRLRAAAVHSMAQRPR